MANVNIELISKLKGALTALVTPFDDKGNVDFESYGRIVDKQLEQGISGLVPCGTTGETPCLSAAEQEKVVRFVVDRVNGRVPVIAGTGSNNTATTIEQTKRAKDWGIDAALVVCPYYNKPTQEGMRRHFVAAHEQGGLPVVAYNVPGRTVSDLQVSTIAALVKDEAIIAIKDATADMVRSAETHAAVEGRPFAMLSGDDFTILPFVATGGNGVVSVVSNLAPGDTVRLVKESAAGNFDVARPLNERIIALSRALFGLPNPIPVKAGLSLAGWCRPDVRLPLVTSDADSTNVVKAAIAAYRGEDTNLEGWMS